MMSTKRRRYASLGGLLALGAPLGLLILRAARAREISSGWLAEELASDAATYLYVGISTILAFCLFGYALGRQADRLQELARTDALTGLLNRRALRDRFDEEFARAERQRSPLSVLLVDVDKLKQLNDRSGHRAGDLALRETAAALKSGSRRNDVCARWGGDEFMVLAPGIGRSEVLHLAERIRRMAASEPGRGLSVSVGVATLDELHAYNSPDALMADADSALYEAKACGRDRVVAR